MFKYYTPRCNVIENWFNQIKHYLKLNKKVLKYDEIVIEVKNAIKQVIHGLFTFLLEKYINTCTDTRIHHILYYLNK